MTTQARDNGGEGGGSSSSEFVGPPAERAVEYEFGERYFGRTALQEALEPTLVEGEAPADPFAAHLFDYMPRGDSDHYWNNLERAALRVGLAGTAVALLPLETTIAAGSAIFAGGLTLGYSMTKLAIAVSGNEKALGDFSRLEGFFSLGGLYASVFAGLTGQSQADRIIHTADVGLGFEQVARGTGKLREDTASPMSKGGAALTLFQGLQKIGIVSDEPASIKKPGD